MCFYIFCQLVGPATKVNLLPNFPVEANASTLFWTELPRDDRRGVITSYTCFYDRIQQAGVLGRNFSGEEVVVDRSCRLSNLTSGSVYAVAVIACTAVGCGPAASINFTTLEISKSSALYLQLTCIPLSCTISSLFLFLSPILQLEDQMGWEFHSQKSTEIMKVYEKVVQFEQPKVQN